MAAVFDDKTKEKLKKISPRIREFSGASRADTNPLKTPTKDAGYLQQLIDQLYGSEASRAVMQGDFVNSAEGLPAEDFLNAQAQMRAKPFSTKKTSMESSIPGKKITAEKSNLSRTFNLLKANAAAHPLATAGTALNAGGNLAGLFDNDKILGQGIGAVVGGLGGKMFELSPLGMTNAAMIGGNLGALFDNLRAKKEREQAYAQYQ